jgi:hypothetical protein
MRKANISMKGKAPIGKEIKKRGSKTHKSALSMTEKAHQHYKEVFNGRKKV